MGLLLSTIAGLVIWIVLWAIGTKSFDAFLIPMLMVLIAGSLRIILPYLPGRGGDEDDGGGWTPR